MAERTSRGGERSSRCLLPQVPAMIAGWANGNMRAALTSVTCSIHDPVLVRFSLKVAHVLPMSYRQSSSTPRGRCKPTMVSHEREQSPTVSNSRCAERIRYRYLSQLQDSEDPQVGLLHRMATDIAGNCGHTLLKAHRLAWRWTVTEAVDAFHAKSFAVGTAGVKELIASDSRHGH